jgi:hypothetical protein
MLLKLFKNVRNKRETSLILYEYNAITCSLNLKDGFIL